MKEFWIAYKHQIISAAEHLAIAGIAGIGAVICALVLVGGVF